MDEKLKDAVAAILKANDKEALAELLVEYVQPTHIATDFVGMLLNTRSLKPGDALVKKVRKGMKVRTLVPGSIHLGSEITVSERVNYVLDGADIRVGASEWDLDNGDIGTVGEIRNEMLAKLRDFYMGKVFTALSTVWTATNTPNNFTNVGGVINATALKNAIDYINQTAGGVKAVIGTRKALTPVTTFGASWSDGSANLSVSENIREIMSTGWLGRYYGAPLIAIEQQYDAPDTYSALIPEDKILVIGHNVGEFITFGDVKTKEWVNNEPTPPWWTLEMYQQFGMIIDRAEGIYVLKVA